METKKCISARRSIRSFTDKAVRENDIRSIAALAQNAPSWKNSQTARLYAVTDKKLLEEICAVLPERNGKIAGSAPLIFAVSSVTGKSGFSKEGTADSIYGEGYTFFDCGLFVQTLCLAAYDLGLGTVIMGLFDPEKIGPLLNIPQGENIIALIPCGYPAEEPQAPPRLPTNEILRLI
jgi:nitroreductase